MLREFLFPLSVTLLLGILIGSERERIQRKRKYHDFAGIRTFALIAVFGFLSAYVDRFVPQFFLVGFATFSLFVVTTYVYNSFSRGFSGITTEVSAIITFLVGFLHLDHPDVSIVVGVLLPLVMSLKELSHRLMAKISDAEFFSTIKFCIIAFIVLPLLPNHTVDPWNLVNPFKLWQTITFISGVSFLGYVFMKVFGVGRGSVLTGLFGGVASSTAVTISFGQESKEVATSRSETMALVTGLMLAVATSFIRIVALTWITNVAVAEALLPRIIIVVGSIFLSVLFLRRFLPRPSHAIGPVNLGSPFSLWKASQFALLLMAILLLSELATHYFGVRGIYLTSVLSGMVKGDGIAVAVATMVHRGSMDVNTAVTAILVSVGTSFVSKTFLARLSGTGRYAKLFGVAMIVPLLVVLACVLLW